MRVHQMMRLRRVRAIDRNNIRLAEQRVEISEARAELCLHPFRQAVAVVIDHADAKAVGAPCNRPANATHADDAKCLAVHTVAQHPAWLPAVPLAGTDELLTLAQPTRDRQDQRHRHICGVLGQNARCVGDEDLAFARGVKINVIHPDTEIGDEFQPW